MKTIDIITSHNVGIDYEAATVMNRGVASFLDLLVMLAYYLIVFFVSLAFGLETWDFSMATVIFYILMLPVLFYSVLMEYLLKGQTVGKLAMGIRVIKLNGENATLSDYAMRWAFRIIDFWISAGSVAAIFIASTEKGQRLGDILAQTAIVKNKPEQVYSIKDILNIMDRSKHEPTYLGVAKFTDEDMILIKNAISRVQKYPNEPHKQLVRELATKAAQELKLNEVPEKKLTFLKTLLQDYIVLTR
ncbi:MAG: RDD family protein [Crocinitomicaceae bacterium]|nr:RDD family protein [Crocinitomicaceae bacterium]MBK9590222.1 RDD family protein [Crocinitomicaceae bacterium]